MKKIVLVLMLALSISACDKKEETTNGKETIKIGAILQLSGSMALSGNTFKELYQLRIAEIPKNSKYNYELIIENDSFEARKTVLASKKLIKDGKAVIIEE